MIGPAEIEDILVELADVGRASPRGDIDPAANRRWGIVPPSSATVADASTPVRRHAYTTASWSGDGFAVVPRP